MREPDHDGDDSQRARAKRMEVERAAIGPLTSHLLIGPEGIEVFFDVRWPESMRRVHEEAKRGRELDTYTQWVLFKDETLALGLDLGWPDLGVQQWLFFPYERWQTELDIVRSRRGLMMLCPEGATAQERLSGALGVRAETDLLDALARVLTRVVRRLL